MLSVVDEEIVTRIQDADDPQIRRSTVSVSFHSCGLPLIEQDGTLLRHAQSRRLNHCSPQWLLRFVPGL